MAAVLVAGLLAAVACTGPSVARAQGFVHLSWDQCDGGVADQTSACDDNTGAQLLYCGFSLAQVATDVVGVEIVLDVQHSAGALPSWWLFGAGACRAGALSASDDPGMGAGACQDFWLGASTGGLQGYSVGQPRGAPNQARIKVALALLSDDARNLVADQSYFAATVQIANVKTTGAGACDGCLEAACLVLNSVEILRLPAAGANVFLQAPGPGNGNIVTWQGAGGANCAAVPVRKATWGAIKALYR